MVLDNHKKALVNALKENDIPTVKKLVKEIYNYDINFNSDVKKLKPLFIAINNYWTDISEELIKNNIGVNDIDNGNSTLMSACMHMQPDIVKLLLEKGLNPNQINSQGATSLSLIGTLRIWDGPEIEYKKYIYEVVQLLIKYKANVNSQDQPIFRFSDDIDILKLFINENADYKSSLKKDNMLSTIPIDTKTNLVHLAALNGDKDVVNYLIELGLSVNQPNEHGWTPLHFAAYANNLSTVEALLAKGADIRAKTTKEYQCNVYSTIQPTYTIDLTPYELSNTEKIRTRLKPF